jgi:hypothetical protein
MNSARIAIATVGLCASLPALADRPLVSDTADVIPTGTCQVESAASRLTSSGVPSARAIGVVFSCGVGGAHQPALGYARARAGGSTEQGFNLGAKTTLVEPADGRPGFGVAYGVGLSKSGSGSFEHDGSSVIGLLTRALGDGLLGHVNLGWSHSRLERASSTVWSLGMETGGDLVWAADLFGDDRSRPWASAGLGWSVLDRFSVNAAYAVQFENPRVRRFSLGLKVGL